MVYGTGWYYDPYSYWGSYYPYPIYYPYPHSYGMAAYYNPYTGTYGRGASVYGHLRPDAPGGQHLLELGHHRRPARQRLGQDRPLQWQQWNGRRAPVLEGNRRHARLGRGRRALRRT